MENSGRVQDRTILPYEKKVGRGTRLSLTSNDSFSNTHSDAKCLWYKEKGHQSPDQQESGNGIQGSGSIGRNKFHPYGNIWANITAQVTHGVHNTDTGCSGSSG